MSQFIRPSQFITTYGPGSILEGQNGPVLMLSIEESGIFPDGTSVRNFEIVDQRFSDSLLDGNRIVRIPTNAELGKPENFDLYTTSSFPAGSLCVEHNIIYRYDRDKQIGCPRCGNMENKGWQKARNEAIRFVMACPGGHLDDVNWTGIVNHRRNNCHPDYMLWKGGGTLSDIEICCPICGACINLGIAYNIEYNCTGRLPEKRQYTRCDLKAKMMQRGAANLRMPEIITSLTIPPRSTELYEIFGTKEARLLFISGPPQRKEDVLRILRMAEENGLIQRNFSARVEQFEESRIMQAIMKTQEQVNVNNENQYRVEELDALQKAATFGEFVVPADTPGAPPRFEVHRTDVKSFEMPSRRLIRVTPVSRLRVVAVQKGYRRLDPVEGVVVETSYNMDGDKWLPGVELHGEGVFVDLEPYESHSSIEHWNMNGQAYNQWLSAYLNPAIYEDQGIDLNYECLHPVFVWWHTLAHRLINALSVDSGYSSAAIRERIYVKHTERGSTGGILLYTAQSGGDGTLGGLIATVPHFDRVLFSALRDVHICSNDPLCAGNLFSPGKYNGAACYACELVSETSCEHRNMFLDRNLLVDNLP